LNPFSWWRWAPPWPACRWLRCGCARSAGHASWSTPASWNGARQAQAALAEQQQQWAAHQQQLEQDRLAAQQHLAEMRRERSHDGAPVQRAIGSCFARAQNCDESQDTISKLLGLVRTFERWHDDMNELIAHNRDASQERRVRPDREPGHHRGLERLHRGRTRRCTWSRLCGGGAGGARPGAAAEKLSKSYRANLYQNDLITTTTFQDLQAGGKMIMGAVIGLDLINKKTRQALAEVA
jgi:hypothetical protein